VYVCVTGYKLQTLVLLGSSVCVYVCNRVQATNPGFTGVCYNKKRLYSIVCVCNRVQATNPGFTWVCYDKKRLNSIVLNEEISVRSVSLFYFILSLETVQRFLSDMNSPENNATLIS
jgi:hypothetical protein